MAPLGAWIRQVLTQLSGTAEKFTVTECGQGRSQLHHACPADPRFIARAGGR
jgi:hypothetical protein